MKRIDQLKPNTEVRLLLLPVQPNTEPETAIFRRIEGEGDDRRAVFTTPTNDALAQEAYDWDAYRFNGGWAYGSSAGRVRLVEVIAPAV